MGLGKFAKVEILVDRGVMTVGGNRLQKRWFDFTFAGVAALLTVAFLPSSAAAQSLGGGLGFAALSLSGDVQFGAAANIKVPGGFPLGNLGGQKVTVAGNSNIDGDAIADPGDINVGNWSQVKGLCVTDAGPGSIILGLPANPPVNFLHCVEGQFTEGGPEADDLANAISDVSTFETTLTTGTTPTQILSTPVTGSGTITDNVSTPYHNIIQVPAVTIGVAQTLQLKGLGAITHPGETMVLWITGPMQIDANAQICSLAV